jgi:hypothetical protein
MYKTEMMMLAGSFLAVGGFILLCYGAWGV